jgi:serine/threonine-protein kinase
LCGSALNRPYNVWDNSDILIARDLGYDNEGLPVFDPASAERNLLFGILALRVDFINCDALVAGIHTWVTDKAKPLGQILVEQGALSAQRHAMLEALVNEHLEADGGDPRKSLATFAFMVPVLQELGLLDDPDVRASLVQTSTVLQGATDAYADGPHCDERPPSRPTPSWLRFRIIRPHARGGLGEVFVAFDEELHRKVALKEIQNRYADHPESRARFLREARITGGLEHPGIVPVYGLGTYPDGRHFYAMRFIQGQTLKAAIAKFHADLLPQRDPGRVELTMRQLLGSFVAVCNAVAYAHSRGILHKDIKPDNVMLGRYGETLLVDWGLAKPMTPLESEVGPKEQRLVIVGNGSTVTQEGQVMRTPAYMSPEQAAVRLDQLGAASDVYSLGATLYFLLTGKAPFVGKEVDEILAKVQNGNFLRPRQANRVVPPPLEAACLKAMALRPEDRYGSALALADDIQRWMANEPVSAYREPRVAKLWRTFIRPRRANRFFRDFNTFCLLIGLMINFMLVFWVVGLLFRYILVSFLQKYGIFTNWH